MEGAVITKSVACDALRRGLCLELRYDGFTRVVEVHAVGTTKDDYDVMRVWQIRGGSQSNERVGWKLLRLDDVFSASVLDEQSEAPRRGYARNDKAMAHITCQL